MLLLARTTPREQVKKRTEGLSVFIVDMHAAGEALKINPIRTMMNTRPRRCFSTICAYRRKIWSARKARGFATFWPA